MEVHEAVMPETWPFGDEPDIVAMRLIMIGGLVLLLLIGFVRFVLLG